MIDSCMTPIFASLGSGLPPLSPIRTVPSMQGARNHPTTGPNIPITCLSSGKRLPTLAALSPSTRQPAQLSRAGLSRQERPFARCRDYEDRLGHQSAKNSFLELLEQLQIVNIQQYEQSLVQSATLRKLEKAIQPSTLEQIKKIQFRQNFLLLRRDICLRSRIVLPTSGRLFASLKGG